MPGRDGEPLVALLAVRVLRLEALLQGVATGLVGALAVFAATSWLVLRGGPVVGPHLALLAQFFPGYRVTFTGSLVGAAWGFGYGFVAGWLVSLLYNAIVAVRRQP